MRNEQRPHATLCAIEIKSDYVLSAATMRPNGWPLIGVPKRSAVEILCCPEPFLGTSIIMTNLRLVLLATTALTAMQFASPASHAQTAPIVVAQAKEELGPDGKPKQPPKGAPPKGAPPKAAPTPPRPPAPPAVAPPRPPAAPPPQAAPPQRPAPPAAPPPHQQPEITRPTPPAAAPTPAAPKPPAAPATPNAPAAHEHERPPGAGNPA